MVKSMAFWRRKPKPLYFLHIPKTAGTSVTSWLTTKVGAEHTCAAKNWDQLVSDPNASSSRNLLFCGHYGWGLNDFLNCSLETATVLRDPIERTWSHYRHVVRDIKHPRHNGVAKQSFEDFLNDRENWSMIENFQARYLVKSPLVLKDYVGRLDPAAAKLNRLSVASEEARYLLEPSYVRQHALENLKSMRVVGVTTKLSRFLSDMTSAFSLNHGDDNIAVPCENIAPIDSKVIEFTTSTIQIIRDLTHLDQEIYDKTLDRLSQEYT